MVHPTAQPPLFPDPSSPQPTRSPNEPRLQSIDPAEATATASWSREKPTVEEAFDKVLSSRFDQSLIGRYLLELSVRIDGHAQAMAFAAMVAKAWRSRRVSSPQRASNSDTAPQR